jgi:hypothetical protein
LVVDQTPPGLGEPSPDAGLASRSRTTDHRVAAGRERDGTTVLARAASAQDVPERASRATDALVAEVLTYAGAENSQAKSTDDADIVDVRYLDIVPNDRVVQAVDFVSDRPEFAGIMTMTWSVRGEGEGTRVEIVAENVPEGISAKDHAAGLASSLDNLARFIEP